MTDKKYKEINILGLSTAILEQLLLTFKTAYFQEKKVIALNLLKKQYEDAQTNKDKAFFLKSIKLTEIEYNKRFKRCEKYNNEVFNSIAESDVNSAENIKQMFDCYDSILCNMFDIFIDAILNVKPGDSYKLFPAWLKESDKGTLFHKGHKFEILDKINY